MEPGMTREDHGTFRDSGEDPNGPIYSQNMDGSE